MNATRTTRNDVLWRWGRGIARALLLTGALTSMTLGTVAYAQIAFRAASSATQPNPQFRAAASAASSGSIGFWGPGEFPASGHPSGNVSPWLPSGWQPNDIHILFVEQKDNDVSTVPAGWTLLNAANSGTAHRASLWWRRAVAGDTNPTVTHNGNSIIAGIIGFRGVDTTTAFDVANSFTVSAADLTTEAAAITTVTPNTMLVFVAMMADNHTSIGLPSGSSPWTQAMFSATSAGSDASIAAHYGLRAAAGAQAAVTATRVGAANAISHGALLALRPALTITIPNPAGTVLDDVMIASIGFRINSPVAPSGITTDIGITPPAGWALVGPNGRLDNAGPTANGLAVYFKVAGDAVSDPGPYTWELACTATCITYGFNAAAGGIVSFSNVDTATPINVENGVPTVALAQTTPNVTTSAANAMLVASHTFASAGTWVPTPGGPLGPMNEAVDVTSGGLSTEINWLLQAAAGPVGQYRATPTPDDDAGNAHILALRPAQQSTITIPRPTVPAATAANDVMIATIGFRPATLPTPPLPLGWNFVRRIDSTDGTLGGAPSSLIVYWKVAGDAVSDPGPYTWNFGPAVGYLAGGILSFSGVDISGPTPIDIDAGNCTPQAPPVPVCQTPSLSFATPSVVTTMANTMLVTSHTYASAGTWTPPPGMTEPVNADVQHGLQSLSAHYVLQAAAGATGTKTATASTDADIGNAHILALRPAVVAVPPPGSLNAFETSTAAGAIAGQIYTKLAGTGFSLDIVAILGGVQQAAFTDTVQVDLVTGSAGGLNCPGTPATIAGTTQSVNLTSGRGTTGGFTVANAYRDVRVRMRYPVASPTVTSCSTDNFTIRPAAFSAPTSNLTNTGNSGTPVATAGAAFTITAVAIAGYDGTPSTDNTKITAHAGAIQNGAVGGTFGAANPATGTATGAAFTYSEVGNFTIGINGVLDNTFTNASTDQGNGDCTADFSNSLVGGRYGCYFGNLSASAVIGRFTPDHFDVSLNPPTFATVCGAGNFTYVGQTFNYTVQPVITVTAKNSAGLGNATTQNYTGASWFKLTNGSLTGKAYTAATGTLNSSGVPGTDPVVADTGAGTASITFSSGTGLFFARSTPVAPFDSEISLAINVIDGDAPAIVYASNPARFGVATPGNGIAFNNGKQMRFGRLRVNNANGSQLLPLPVLMEIQHWNGTVFVTNTADVCTSIAAGNVTMANYTGNLSGSPTCETAISGGGVFSAGRRTFQLAAPGAANDGSVDLTVNLGAAASGNTCTTQGGAPAAATTANRPYLQGNWTGGAYDQNPAGRTTFGGYRGAEEVIFIRENF